MGQVDLRQLRAAGQAAARFVEWINRAESDVDFARIEPQLQTLIDREGANPDLDLPEPFTFGRGSWSESGGDWNSAIWLRTEAEARAAGAGWFLALGSFGGYDEAAMPPDLAARKRELGLHPSGLFLEPRVEVPGFRGDWGPGVFKFETSEKTGWIGLGLGPEMVRRLRSVNKPRREAKRLLQEVEGFVRYPTLRIDPNWSPRDNCDSTMAQLAEWLLRGTAVRDRGLPALDEDALAWFHRWAIGAARRTGGDPPTVGDLFELVGRTLPPDSPAGQRLFYRKSLGPRGERDAAKEAAARLGIGRSTLYAWLRAEGRTASEVREASDSVAALVHFGRGRKSARLNPRDREVVDVLISAGMKDNSARRAERRTRDLPPEDRARRLRVAIRHAHRGR